MPPSIIGAGGLSLANIDTGHVTGGLIVLVEDVGTFLQIKELRGKLAELLFPSGHGVFLVFSVAVIEDDRGWIVEVPVQQGYRRIPGERLHIAWGAVNYQQIDRLLNLHTIEVVPQPSLLLVLKAFQ